jgi:hypothetical protein
LVEKFGKQFEKFLLRNGCCLQGGARRWNATRNRAWVRARQNRLERTGRDDD